MPTLILFYIANPFRFFQIDSSVNFIKRVACISAITNARHSILEPKIIDEFSYTTSSDDPVARFVLDWVTTVSDAITCIILVQFCQIPKLSQKGVYQFTTDITYIGNIFNAMGLKQHPLLDHITSLLKIERNQFQKYLTNKIGVDPVLLALRNLDNKIYQLLYFEL